MMREEPAPWMGTPEFAAFRAAYAEMIQSAETSIMEYTKAAGVAARDIIAQDHYNQGDIDRALATVRNRISDRIAWRRIKAHLQDTLISYENGYRQPPYLPTETITVTKPSVGE